MIRYLLRRIAFGLAVIVIVTSSVFALTYVAGDPAASALGARARPSQLEAFRRKHGLNAPITEQFTAYLGVTPCLRHYAADDPTKPREGAGCGLLQGDLGRSYMFDESVSTRIATRLPRTLLLGALALGFEILFGLVAGFVAAIRRNHFEDFAILVSTSVAASLPTFVVGPLALYVLAYLCGYFPVGGLGTTPMDQLRHALLPALVLSIGGAASYARLFRSELLDAYRSEYIRAARARGLPERKVMRHAVRNALGPIAQLIGLSLPGLVAGAIITEKIFAWPGLGLLSVDAITALDSPTILAVVLLGAMAVQVGNIAADIALASLDPRVRLGSERR